jgi:hypothetical protein
MSFSVVISVVALIVSGISATAAVYAVKTTRDAAKIKVSVNVWHKAQPEPQYIHVLDRPAPRAKYYQLEIEVVNDGETTEFITAIYLARSDLADAKRKDLETDHELKPHARLPTTVDAATLPEITGGPFIVFVALARGPTIRSAVQSLKGDVQLEVDESKA